MDQITMSLACPDCQKGKILLVGSGFKWTRQCTECGITEVIPYEKKLELMKGVTMILEWYDTSFGKEAIMGDFNGDDGVRFSIEVLQTCYRRGRHKLLVEVADKFKTWGCFDEQDQPMRYYHTLACLQIEAQAIADVLWRDHEEKTKKAV